MLIPLRPAFSLQTLKASLVATRALKLVILSPSCICGKQRLDIFGNPSFLSPFASLELIVRTEDIRNLSVVVTVPPFLCAVSLGFPGPSPASPGERNSLRVIAQHHQIACTTEEQRQMIRGT